MKDRSFGVLCFLGGSVFAFLLLLLANLKAITQPSAFDIVVSLGSLASFLAVASAIYIALRNWDREDERQKTLVDQKRRGIAYEIRRAAKELMPILNRELISYQILKEFTLKSNSIEYSDGIGKFRDRFRSVMCDIDKTFVFDYLVIGEFLEPKELNLVEDVRTYLNNRVEKVDTHFDFIFNREYARLAAIETRCRHITNLENENIDVSRKLNSLINYLREL